MIEKHMTKEQDKKMARTKVQTKDHTQKCKTHNGKLLEEKTLNLKPKPITSSMKQVMQRRWAKKPRRTPSLEEVFLGHHNCSTQDSVSLNSLKNH